MKNVHFLMKNLFLSIHQYLLLKKKYNKEKQLRDNVFLIRSSTASSLFLCKMPLNTALCLGGELKDSAIALMIKALQTTPLHDVLLETQSCHKREIL